MTLCFLGLFSKCSGCRNPHPGHTIEDLIEALDGAVSPRQEGTIAVPVETPAEIVAEANIEPEAEADNAETPEEIVAEANIEPEAEVPPILEALAMAKCFPEQTVHSIEERSQKQLYLQSLNRTGSRQKMWAGMTKYGTLFAFSFFHLFFVLI
jgi:hypothetical protein